MFLQNRPCRHIIDREKIGPGQIPAEHHMSAYDLHIDREWIGLGQIPAEHHTSAYDLHIDRE